jgi:predicted Fe-Mo cluster-binding NifX family protein
MGETLNDPICLHFGRAPYFLIVDQEIGSVEVMENRGEHMGGVGKPPEHIAARGAKVMLCGGLGPKAIEMLRSYDIRTYVGAQGTVGDAIQQWTDGNLCSADEENACKEHKH